MNAKLPKLLHKRRKGTGNVLKRKTWKGNRIGPALKKRPEKMDDLLFRGDPANWGRKKLMEQHFFENLKSLLGLRQSSWQRPSESVELKRGKTTGKFYLKLGSKMGTGPKKPLFFKIQNSKVLEAIEALYQTEPAGETGQTKKRVPTMLKKPQVRDYPQRRLKIAEVGRRLTEEPKNWKGLTFKADTSKWGKYEKKQGLLFQRIYGLLGTQPINYGDIRIRKITKSNEYFISLKSNRFNKAVFIKIKNKNVLKAIDYLYQ